jgi:hypothetical protein
MKAPDKIYIQTNAGEAFSSKWTTIPFRDFENTEYIRKDTLLEWAKEHKLVIETHGDERDAYLRGVYSALNSLIHKLNEM